MQSHGSQSGLIPAQPGNGKLGVLQEVESEFQGCAARFQDGGVFGLQGALLCVRGEGTGRQNRQQGAKPTDGTQCPSEIGAGRAGRMGAAEI